MKTTLLALLALATSAFAGNSVTLAWDDTNPAGSIASYVIYEQSGATWVKVQDVIPAATTATIQNVPPGIHTYAVTGVAPWNVESVRSNSALYVTSINAMKNLKVIQVIVTP